MSDVTVFNAPAPLDVEEIRRRVVPVLARYRAVKAFLIGSYARGSADAWSDIDLVIVMDSDKPFVERPRDLTDLFEALPTAVDLLIYTPSEFERGMQRGRNIFDTIAREGIPIF